MILQSLYRYYEILLEDPEAEIAPPGYSAANVSFALNLSQDGELLDLFPFTTKFFDGKKDREVNYRRMIVPEQVKRAGIDPKPNFLCDNSTFILGISEKKTKEGLEDSDYIFKRFEAFRKYNIGLLSKANSVEARSVVEFLEKLDSDTIRQHPAIAQNMNALLAGGNLIFLVDGRSTILDAEIRRIWEESRSNEETVQMQCLVSGEVEPIARLHPNIQGVRDANPTGASLVGFNERAYESYGRVKGQGLNSPTGQRIASGYGVALNYLLSAQNPNRKIQLGDTTVVYWAESINKKYASTFATLINPAFWDDRSVDGQGDQKEAEAKLAVVAGKVAHAQALDFLSLQEGLDPQTRFFVLGLAPNAARLSVRFFLTDAFGKFVERIMIHYEDLQIQKEFQNQHDTISPYRILAECVSPKVTRRDDELKSTWGLMGGALMRSILTGAPYPEGLYSAIINRVRHDNDDENRSRKINYVRAAFIKAYLLRKFRRQAQKPYLEALQMSLNKSYTHPAYVLGRLFAVLEKVQREAIGDVNAGIKDRYFTSACATPASVFPTLMRLSQHWTSKAEYGRATDRKIQDLMELLAAEPFPARLTLDEQGIFILGYYHQRASFFTKNTDKSSGTESVVR